MSKRTITISNRQPVTIEEDNWPVIASASDEDHDGGQVRSQANRVSKWSCTVRQHEDGRAIVYSVYSYTTNWQNARGYSAKAGRLLPVGASYEDISRAITNVCHEIAEREHNGDDALRWKAIEADCIADLPAEELD